MSFARLLRADAIALAAALALLLLMAADWYSTNAGEEARRIEQLSQPEGALGGEVERRVQEDAALAAEGAEKNAWQLSGLIDRVILLGLLATVGLAIAAAYLRAAAKRFDPPLTPSGLAALTATVTALLLAYRAIQTPDIEGGATTVRGALPIAIAVLGVIAVACSAAFREEEGGSAWRRSEAR